MLAAGRRDGDDVRPLGLAVGVGGMAKTIGARMGMAADTRAGVKLATASPFALGSGGGRAACHMIFIGSGHQYRSWKYSGDSPLVDRRMS